MNQQLEAEASKILRTKLEGMGMHMHLGVKTTEILVGDDGAVSGVTFTDGSTLDCDTVVVAAGIRPNIGLAMVSGLETAARDRRRRHSMRSVDDDDIYVVGECAQHRGEVYGLVAPLWEQAGGARRRRDRREPRRRLPRLAARDEAQGGRRRRRVDGRQGARSATTTSSSSSPRPAAASTRRVIIRDGHADRRHPRRRRLQGRVPDPGLRQRARPLPDERCQAAVRPRRRRRRGRRRRPARRHPGLQLQRRLQGRAGGVRRGRRGVGHRRA